MAQRLAIIETGGAGKTTLGRELARRIGEDFIESDALAQEKMTLERLAEMINEGLKPTASKEDIKEVRSEVGNLRTEIRAEFDRIENLLMEEQKREIENLEARMKKLADTLAIEPSCKSGQALRQLLAARVRPQRRRSSCNRLVIQPSPGVLLFWRSTDEHLTQGAEVAQCLRTAKHQPVRRGRRRK
jgi:shikimate kinase